MMVADFYLSSFHAHECQKTGNYYAVFAMNQYLTFEEWLHVF